jgi:hypothetical protein
MQPCDRVTWIRVFQLRYAASAPQCLDPQLPPHPTEVVLADRVARRRLAEWFSSDLSQATTFSRQRGAWIRDVYAMTQCPFGSDDADVIRASQLQHAVEDMHSYVNFSHPTFVST